MTFLPQLSLSDVERAAQLIERAYGSFAIPPDEQKALQRELSDIQRRPEAWGLVLPFLAHPNPNVQFFGAHTAQVKIARDWDSFPQEAAFELRDLLLDLISRAILARKPNLVLRKLFVALPSLALKLVPGAPSRWPDWIVSCVSHLSAAGAPTDKMLDLLSIVVQDVDAADLLGPAKLQMKQSLVDAIPLVVRAISLSIDTAADLIPALKCLEAWTHHLPSDALTALIPPLVRLLDPVGPSYAFDEARFVPASDALQEILSKSAFADGGGTHALTEPLLVWADRYGPHVVERTRTHADAEISSSFCKLLVALGDHSTSYLASHLASADSPVPIPTSRDSSPRKKSKGELVQSFLRLLLAYTALPGTYGRDEDLSESTLGFWYLFQEALWSVDDDSGDGREGVAVDLREGGRTERSRREVAKAVYRELVSVLRRKVVWPDQSWPKDLEDKFRVYRRDVGDTLINAYYILRDEMLAYFIADIIERLSHPDRSYEEIEATLHCIGSIQEAIPLENGSKPLARVFGDEILGRLPASGTHRVRRTTLTLIGTYASWFTTQSLPSGPTGGGEPPSALIRAIEYVASALHERALCFPAANAFRDVCDANRKALVPHIDAFIGLLASLGDIPDTEKGKVVQSVASVIQAMPPEEEILPIEAIAGPVVANLMDALRNPAQLSSEDAAACVAVQLQTLAGIARGLTRMQDSVLLLSEDSPEEDEAAARMRLARDDPRMRVLRERIFGAARDAMDVWSLDAGVSDAISDLFKAVTALPADATLLTLPAGALLGLVCFAARRQLTAIWLGLASMLVGQLNPGLLLPSLRPAPNEEAREVVGAALPMLVQTALEALGQPGAMVAHPDVVQSFFGCMETVAGNFVSAFHALPNEMFDALMRCSVGALSSQERYSLVAACQFLATFVNRTYATNDLAPAQALFVERHARPILRALLEGFAAVAPRSAMQNLVELLALLVGKCHARCRLWIREIMFADDFVHSRAGRDAKEKFIKGVLSAKSLKRTREAVQAFVLVARGLEGSGFGYAAS